MIAILSSTLAPSPEPSHDGPRTNLGTAERLDQTVASVRSFEALGFADIFLADNSPEAPNQAAIAKLAPARVFHFGHFPHRNKGLGEAYLLLALCPLLPAGRPIMKLSARYRASRNLCPCLGDFDLAGRFARTGRRGAEDLSTRAYAVRDRDFLARFLRGTLDEMYAAPWRIVGPRSIAAIMRQLLQPDGGHPHFSDPVSSLEISAARWLRRSRTRVLRLNQLGISGVLGSWINPHVEE